MGIPHRDVEGAVPEQLLDGSRIHVAAEQAGGERMAEAVVSPPFDPKRRAGTPKHLPEPRVSPGLILSIRADIVLGPQAVAPWHEEPEQLRRNEVDRALVFRLGWPLLASAALETHADRLRLQGIPCTNRRCCGACRVSRLSGAWRAQQSGPDGWRHGGGAA